MTNILLSCSTCCWSTSPPERPSSWHLHQQKPSPTNIWESMKWFIDRLFLRQNMIFSSLIIDHPPLGERSIIDWVKLQRSLLCSFCSTVNTKAQRRTAAGLQITTTVFILEWRSNWIYILSVLKTQMDPQILETSQSQQLHKQKIITVKLCLVSKNCLYYLHWTMKTVTGFIFYMETKQKDLRGWMISNQQINKN